MFFDKINELFNKNGEVAEWLKAPVLDVVLLFEQPNRRQDWSSLVQPVFRRNDIFC